MPTAPPDDDRFVDGPDMTVREFAAQESVSIRTVYRWIDKGAVAHRHTAGGGVRILDRRQTPRRNLTSADNG